MRDGEKTLFGCLGVIAYVAITVPLTSLLYGWALAKLWAWFMVPALNLPSLGIASAIGVSTVIRLVTYQPDASRESDEDGSAVGRLVGATIQAVMLPLIMLGFGWCVKQFV